MKAKILEGNVLETLKDLPDCSVQCVVTSPPYYGLRDYGMEGQIGLEATPPVGRKKCDGCKADTLRAKRHRADAKRRGRRIRQRRNDR